MVPGSNPGRALLFPKCVELPKFSDRFLEIRGARQLMDLGALWWRMTMSGGAMMDGEHVALSNSLSTDQALATIAIIFTFSAKVSSPISRNGVDRHSFTTGTRSNRRYL